MKNICDWLCMTPECEKNLMHYIFFMVVMMFFGAIGGIARGSYERLTSGIKLPKDYDYNALTTKKQRRNFWLQHIFLGIGGGACAILLTLLLSKFELKVDDICSVILYSCISVLGGIVAKRCLPILSDAAAKKIGEELQRNKSEAIEYAKEEARTVKKYAQLISDADTALNETDETRIKAYAINAIKDMEQYLDMYSSDRHFCIKLGRLYRKLSDITGKIEYLNKAILVLREYVKNIKSMKRTGVSDCLNISTALFNIACYHSLLTGKNPEEFERIAGEAVKALEEAFKLDSNVKNDLSDPDLNNISKVIASSEILNK